jgi:hypothetical protein
MILLIMDRAQKSNKKQTNVKRKGREKYLAVEIGVPDGQKERPERQIAAHKPLSFVF